MNEVMERSRTVSEPMEWAKAEGKHAEMHLVRRAALLAINQVVEHVGINETASDESRHVHPGSGSLAWATLHPLHIRKNGYGERRQFTNYVVLGERETPEVTDGSYDFMRDARFELARIEESGRFNFEATYNKLTTGIDHGFGGEEPKAPKTHRDTYYRPGFVVKRFISGVSSKPWNVSPVSEVRMMANSNLDVRDMRMWTPEAMVDHYESQINQLGVFMDEVATVASAAGAYIHSSTHLEYYRGAELPERMQFVG